MDETDLVGQTVSHYAGVSFGASMPLLALEEQLKTAVLLAPGFSFRAVPSEAG